MQIRVLLFGITRDIVGENILDLSLSRGITVEKLKTQLTLKYADLANYNYAVAINETYAEDDSELNENDIVALIPPVSGG